MARTVFASPAARAALTLVVFLVLPDGVEAQSRLGGHFGCMFPLLTRSHGQAVTLADDFVIGFPTGITIRKTDTVAFDLELVPTIQNEPLDVMLTVHPGVIFTGRNHMAGGIRMAFDVNTASWGFTPLVSRGFSGRGSSMLFVEGRVPIRFQEDFRGDNMLSIGVGVHVGVSF